MSQEITPDSVTRNGWTRSSRPPLRQLWQVPAFGAGLLALLLVSAVRPLYSTGQPPSPGKLLTLARGELQESRPDLEMVIARAEQVLNQPQSSRRQIGEANFLLGSAYLRRAELSSQDLATVSWQQAREHLEEARRLGVPNGDEPKLLYRLGKVCFVLNVEPALVVELLSRTVNDAADDAFESHGMLARAYLRLPQPDYRAALETTQKQLGLPNMDPVALAQPRLMCSELLLHLEQREEARQVLSRIGPEAPPEILFKARYMRASLLQEDGVWADAAAQWELVRTDPRVASVGLGRVLYHLGLCYRRVDRPTAAAAVWEEGRKQPGEEGQAAALGLAELRLRTGNAAAALEAFQSALRQVAAPADYRNALIDLTEARNLFEASCRWYLQTGNYEGALQLARLYEKISLPGVSQELGGQAAQGWGKLLLEKARQATTAEAARPQEEEARKRFREAGALFETAAGLSKNPVEKADWLWFSAKDYLLGQDPTRALPVLEHFVSQPIAPERLGEAWFIRGECFRTLHNSVAAQADYRHCIQFPGPFAYRARYQLALLEMDQKNLEEAEAILTQNLAIMKTAADRDEEAYEKSLHTLAGLLLQRRDYFMASVRLQEALERYPTNAHALKLRFQLAQCFGQLAEQASQKINDDKSTPEERTHYRTQRQRYLETAVLHYRKVADDGGALQSRKALPAEDDGIVHQAAFAVGDCRFDLGQFDEALKIYEELAVRFQGQVEVLLALRHVWQCYGVKFQPDQARKTLERMRATVKELPASAFDNSVDVRSKRWWDDWLREKNRPSE